MITSSKGNKKPEDHKTTLTAKLFHNLCQVDPQGSAWHPPFYGGVSPLPFSGAVLKWIAIVTMLIDHIGAAIFLFYFRRYPKTPALGTLYDILRDVGRVAFPIFVFLLVEGFLHSKNSLKYLLRLAVFALVSEIPFDLAFHDKLFYWEKQNVFFTLFLGLAAVQGMSNLEKTVWKLCTAPEGEKPDMSPAVGRIYLAFSNAGLVLLAFVLAELMNTDYHGLGVLAICIMYFFRHKPLVGAGLCSLVLLASSLRELYSLAALIPISLYNGKRGRQAKYFFYAFYPVHLLILYLLRRYLILP